GDALRDEVRVASGDARAEGEGAGGDGGAHGGAGHHLDAGGDDDVVGTGDDALRREVGGLLRGAALAVDGGGRDGLGEAGGEHGVAAHVQALVPDLHDAAHDHVVDQSRVEVVALHEGLEHLSAQVGGVP